MTANLAARESRPADFGTSAPLPGARLALTLLIFINLFNYIDRQVLASVEPEIRKELFPDSELPTATNEMKADAKSMMGWLGAAFLITYMVAAPLFGFLADRIPRWWLIGIGVLLWTGASGGSGGQWGMNLALAYWLLFLTRCFVGIGEAAYGPVAPTLISDLYPIKQRGWVMSWFYMAIPFGGALGYALGEIVVKSFQLDWRWAFYLVVPPGVILGLWCFWMPEPASGGADRVQRDKRKPTWNDYLSLVKTPSYVLNTLGMTGMTFAIGGLAMWMPDYLETRNVQPFMGLGPRTFFGVLTALGGLIATLTGGLAGDWLRPRFSGSYFLVSGAAMIVACPMILLMLWAPFPMAWIFVGLAVFCLFFNTGPTNTILANVTHPSVRATGFALNIFVIHILGDVPAMPLLGYVSGKWGWNASFGIVAVSVIVGGLFWLAGAGFLQRDTALAPLRLDGPGSEVPSSDPFPDETH